MPPGRVVSAAAPAASLPADLTRLVGRQREVAEIRQLLAGERLVTLTGAGGSGKTRLALAVAAEVTDSFDTVSWIEMATLGESRLVPRQVAAACGVREGAAPSEELLVAALASSRRLLVLDNCEHVVDGCARLVDRLLRGCRGLTVLATSREALGIAGEQAWLVPPLALPPEEEGLSLDEILTSPAVELFVERARAIRPDFALTEDDASEVAQICRRLDGLPLALELAAARIKVLTPRDLAGRLDDAFSLLTTGARTAPPRHRTLRATLEWSYRLLSEPERAVLRRLAVFAGAFDLAAAEAVASGEGVERPTVLDLLAALVDRSLVGVEPCRGESRYRLLETVRQYAAERLAEAGEREAAVRRHGRHFLALAEEAEPAVFGGDGGSPWMVRLDRDTPDLRAAFDGFAADPEGRELALRLAYALHWYWFARGRFREARERLTAALATAGENGSAELEALALAALARVALWQGDRQSVASAAERALARLPADAAAEGRAYVLNAVGIGHSLGGDHRAALRAFRAAAECSAGAAPVLGTLVAAWRARSELALGDHGAARAGLEEVLAVGRRLGHRPAIGHPLSMLGRIHELEGDEAAARRAWTEALGVHLAAGDGWGLQHAMEGMARLALAGGDAARAARLLGCADAARNGLGSSLLPDEEPDQRRAIEAARQVLGDDAFAAAWTAGSRLSRAAAVALALEGGAVDLGELCCGPSGVVRLGGAETAPAPVARPASIAVLALGPFEVRRNGERLDSEVWGASKPRELLLFLLTHPHGVAREQVGLALWPEASAAQLRNSFHVTLHRVRRALGDAGLVTVGGDRYAVAPALVARFDVHRFEEAARAALAAAATSEEGAASLEEALGLYRGELLAGEAIADWCRDLREQLAALHRRLLHVRGGQLLAGDRVAEAAEVFDALLSTDGLDEEACRGLMLCQVRLHRRSESLRLYQRLVERLREELDAVPDAVTNRLFERLQAGEPV